VFTLRPSCFIIPALLQQLTNNILLEIKSHARQPHWRGRCAAGVSKMWFRHVSCLQLLTLVLVFFGLARTPLASSSDNWLCGGEDVDTTRVADTERYELTYAESETDR
jgi:hypothetical protein